MITRFRVQNYKALKDVSLDLTPVHVLIGPNDSGKTSILEAMAALSRSADYELPAAFSGSWSGRDLVRDKATGRSVELGADLKDDAGVIRYTVTCDFAARGREAFVVSESVAELPDQKPVQLRPFRDPCTAVCSSRRGMPGPVDTKPWADRIYASLAGTHYYRWNPRFLSLPNAPDAQRRFRMEPNGFGLTLCLDDILGYDRERFASLEKRFRDVFPDVRSIKLVPERGYKAPTDHVRQLPMLQESDGKALYIEFTGPRGIVPASQVSDGMLLVLAYLTVLHLPEPPTLILVEEPENGIHPKRLADVLRILRDLVSSQSKSQVVLTTHSPYLLDSFSPEEVTLCRKDDDGSVSTHRLSDSRKVREQINVFTLGEIWSAEGDDALAEATKGDGQS